MTIYSCNCWQCNHKFFCLETECQVLERVACPMCGLWVEVDELEKPKEAKWSSCRRKKCSNCANKCTKKLS